MFSKLFGIRKSPVSGSSSFHSDPSTANGTSKSKTGLTQSVTSNGKTYKNIKDYEVKMVPEEYWGYFTRKAQRTPENIETDAMNITYTIVNYLLIVNENEYKRVGDLFKEAIKSKEIDSKGFLLNLETNKIFITDLGFDFLYNFIKNNHDAIEAFSPQNKDALIQCVESDYLDFEKKLEEEDLI